MIRATVAALTLLGLSAVSATAQPAQLAATEFRRMESGASQGVAVDAGSIYAVSNFRITKFDKATGAKVAEWVGTKERFPHINSCAVLAKELVCAASNFPATPMTSSVEIFDPKTMKLTRTVSLGQQIGSLTWVDRKDGFWWAGFANYDGKGGEPNRGHQYSQVVKFDDQWRRLEGWSFPASVLERFAPMSTSGGAWGEDGLLYVTGHDLPEVYALKLPLGGSVLDHVATIAASMEGQAIAFDRSTTRSLYGITRKTSEVVAVKLPKIDLK